MRYWSMGSVWTKISLDVFALTKSGTAGSCWISNQLNIELVCLRTAISNVKWMTHITRPTNPSGLTVKLMSMVKQVSLNSIQCTLDIAWSYLRHFIYSMAFCSFPRQLALSLSPREQTATVSKSPINFSAFDAPRKRFRLTLIKCTNLFRFLLIIFMWFASRFDHRTIPKFYPIVKDEDVCC